MADIAEIIRPTVHTRAEWGGAWIARPALKPQTVRRRLSPSLPEAAFRWDYGEIDANDGEGAAAVEKLDLAGHFVRISDPGPPPVPIWYGVILAETDLPAMEGGAEPTGLQILAARGLEWLLTHSPVDGSYVEIAGAPQKIDRVLPFNLRHAHGLALQGNRSADKETRAGGGGSSYVFSNDGSVWTAEDIAEYLITWFTEIDYGFDLSGLHANLAAFGGAVAGPKTVADGLNALANRRRGHAWAVEVDGADDTMAVKIYSAFDEDVTVGGVTIGTTADVIVLERRWYTSLQVTSEHVTEYEKVVVRGSPILLVGTFSFDGGTLEEAWGAAAETAYEAEADDDARKDEIYQSVFTAFRVPFASVPGGPTSNADGTLAAGPAYALPFGKSILRQIPLELTDDDAWAPAGFRSPLVVISDNPGGAANYVPVDKIAKPNTLRRNMSVIPLDGEIGFRLTASPNYALGHGHYNHGASYSYAEDLAVDYESIYATAAWYSDEHLSVTEDLAAGGTAGTLIVDVPEAQCWYRLANTMVDCADGTRTVEAAAATLRTDAAQLTAIAAMVKSWYLRDRRACKARMDDLDYQDMLGYMLEAFTNAADPDVEVGSLISEIRWDFHNATTTIKTDFTELDFVGLAGSVGAAGGGGRGPAGAAALAAPAGRAAPPAPDERAEPAVNAREALDAPHQSKLLSEVHTDTTAADPVRGDLITGQGAAPNTKWARKGLGTEGQMVTSDGADVIWSTPTGHDPWIVVTGTGGVIDINHGLPGRQDYCACSITFISLDATGHVRFVTCGGTSYGPCAPLPPPP